MSDGSETYEQGRERLEELEEHIQAVRKESEDALGGPLHSEERFYESGTRNPEEDDQTIAPPG